MFLSTLFKTLNRRSQVDDKCLTEIPHIYANSRKDSFSMNWLDEKEIPIENNILD